MFFRKWTGKKEKVIVTLKLFPLGSDFMEKREKQFNRSKNSVWRKFWFSQFHIQKVTENSIAINLFNMWLYIGLLFFHPTTYVTP